VSDVEPSEAGLASGVVNTSFMMGDALGLAILASSPPRGPTRFSHLGKVSSPLAPAATTSRSSSGPSSQPVRQR
jgi:hypothetical protein